jgi:hypothetical protein
LRQAPARRLPWEAEHFLRRACCEAIPEGQRIDDASSYFVCRIGQAPT